jgi:DNA-binding transcriptional LysR family regulator
VELEVRHLRVVATVARHGSVPAAAASLGVAESVLGSEVLRIERLLGCTVFRATGSGVECTAVGERVVARARAVLDELAGLREDIRSSASARGPLRISSDSMRFFSSFVGQAYATDIQRPLMPVPPLPGTTTTEALVDGRVDVAVVVVLAAAPPSDLPMLGQRAVVEREPLLVALSASHPLAGRRCVDITDLADEDWILPPSEIDPGSAATAAVVARLGMRLRSTYGPHDLGPLWPAVVAGRAVSFAVPTASAPPGGVLRPLTGQPITARRVLRWRRGALDEPDVERCARAAGSAYREQLTHTAQTQEWWRSALSEEKPTLAP